MLKLIKDAQLIDNDPWTLVEKDTDELSLALAQGTHVILPLQLWLANADQCANKENIGVWLDSDDNPDTLADRVESLALIAINFPAFTDGRGYSHARRLRLNMGFENELRAFGDVLRDQMQFYLRCGFNSFALRSDAEVDGAIKALNDFSIFYQDAADNYLPPLARR